MVGWGLEQIADLAAPVVVDLCTGSGAIAKAIATEHPDARVHAVECDPGAAAWAARNLAGMGIDLRVGDVSHAVDDLIGLCDLVICNPPYVPLRIKDALPAEVVEYDPEVALFSGEDGLELLRVIAPLAGELLRPGGVVALEHAECHEFSVPEILHNTGQFTEVGGHADLTGRPRFATARRLTDSQR